MSNPTFEQDQVAVYIVILENQDQEDNAYQTFHEFEDAQKFMVEQDKPGAIFYVQAAVVDSELIVSTTADGITR